MSEENRLFADINSIERAAANGLPFCDTDEKTQIMRGVIHLIQKSLKELDGTGILTADRDLLTLAGPDLIIFYVYFDQTGSHMKKVTEPASASLTALSHFIGEKSAKAVLDKAGGFEAAGNISFFGIEKRIARKSEEIKACYERLCEYTSLAADQLIERLLSEERIIPADQITDQEEQREEADTSEIALIGDQDQRELMKNAAMRLRAGEHVVFYDIKDLLHRLGALKGLPSEIKGSPQIVEDKDGQLSLFTDKDRPAACPEADLLYDAIMETEQRAWQESLSGEISYGRALNRYFDDVRIESYIADPLEEYTPGSAQDMALAHDRYREQLRRNGEEELYTELELPLVFVLYDMERTGIYMDAIRLKKYGEQLLSHMEELEKKIYSEAGGEFNINSPKQLGEVLFDRLHLPSGKKTKTGYSTSQKVLSELAGDYPIVADVLSYRKYAKLKSTYADGLFSCVNADGRVHTTFQQTVTATGRLSSTAPNLQNIPIRLELGKQIRKVFLPASDALFLDADYSQIELRVLADMSGDKNLIEAYRSDRDIHTATASAVFHVSTDQVTPEMRRSAKAVNFGIVYGISSFGLGENLSISRKQAQEYINDYFKAYPRLHEFLDSLVTSAKENGFAVTKYGRRRPIPELSDPSYMKRQFGERVAMNAPIQGSAADIIKIAMLNVYSRLRREGLSSKLLLSVHDELLIEAKQSEKEEAERILKEEMENAASLQVPLLVDLKEGNDWYSAH